MWTLAVWQSMNTFYDQVLVYTMQLAFSALWWSVWGLAKYLEVCTFSHIFAKPGHMADTLSILALPSLWSLWLFPLSMLSFSPNCWLCHELPKTWYGLWHWDCSWMHLAPAVRHARCMVCCSSMQPCRVRSPQQLNAAHMSSSNLRQHYLL